MTLVLRKSCKMQDMTDLSELEDNHLNNKRKASDNLSNLSLQPDDERESVINETVESNVSDVCTYLFIYLFIYYGF